MDKISNLAFIAFVALVITFFVLQSRGFFDREKTKDLKCSGSTIDKNSAKTQAVSARNTFITWNISTYESALDNLLAYSNPDLCEIANEYKNLYSQKEYPTLRSIVESLWIIGFSAEDKRDKLLARLNSIA